tara:strand:- start:6 stop:188 length:183 start_codon:yes stop_codon:yes gene_type:complete
MKMNKKLIKSISNIIENNQTMREGADPAKVAKKNLEEIMKLSETGDLKHLQELFKPKGDN